MAACETRTKLDSTSMEWEAFLNMSSTSTEPVWVRQATHEPLMSKDFPDRQLLDASNQPLIRYAYHVSLKTNKPWKVPLLFGRLPRTPDEASPPKERHVCSILDDAFSSASIASRSDVHNL